MLRRSIFTTLVSLLLAAGLMTAAPTARADVPYDNSIGIIKVPNQVRKGNCAKYRLRWDFNPPSDEWTVIGRIRTPKGFSIVSQFWDSNSPNNLGREKGRLRIQLCGSSVKPGRYKVEMQMVYSVGRNTYTVNRRPTYFRLLRHR
ncbi:hypothetical protein [Nocardioides sp.]|uniref:hypothetical protein n=1 Tax=Nocardioides sp. TaxID=35761 RepID=UPI0027274D3B|nr:hypothetical protein [Nocardioides sp.]MDO9456487.1 hypothetical protein [Nocardioides sp.]